MEPIDSIIEAWFNEWWPEELPQESNVPKKKGKSLEISEDDIPF